jgi:cell division protein ZipA
LDGLRLALLILGIVVVAVVYFWTSRRRRFEREAGDFDRFDAWTNEELDPLAPPGADPNAGLAVYDDVAVDADELTQPKPRLSASRALGRRNDEESRIGDGEAEEPVGQAGAGSNPVESGRVDAAPVESAPIDALYGASGDDVQADDLRDHSSALGIGSTADAKVMNDLEAVANSAQARVTPQVGSLDEIDLDSQPSGPVISSSSESVVDSTASPADNDEAGLPAANTMHTPPSLTGQGAVHKKGHKQEQEHEQDSERGSLPPRDGANEDGVADGGVQDTAEMVVVLNVMATAGQFFDGPALKVALESAGLKAGDMQLYHYRTEAQSAESAPIYSALNAVRPGTLDVDEFDGMRTPGIAMVLRMHGIERPSEAFELMLGAARCIADELDGQVCDETRSTLTGQALNHLRERISAVAFRARSGS